MTFRFAQVASWCCLFAVLGTTTSAAASPEPEAATNTTSSSAKHGSTATQWLSALGAAIVVSLPSLLGVIILPFTSPRFTKWVMVPLLAFATGSLVGDSLLHLIPEVFGLHNHDEHDDEEKECASSNSHDEHEHEHDHTAELLASDSYVWKALMIFVGLLMFFVLEKVVRWLSARGEAVHGHHHADEHPKCPHHDTLTECVEYEVSVADVSEPLPEVLAEQVRESEARDKRAAQPPTHIEPMGYISLCIDFLHNLIDGIGIGTAFAVSTAFGWTTALTVLFHEIPQELGDVALLQQSGFSKRMVLLLNGATSVSCLVGALIGVGIGTASDTALTFVLALTAGGFLYLGLSDLIPDFVKARSAAQSVLHTACMCLGVLVMFAMLFAE